MKTRATPVGDKESEPCQFAFNGFLKAGFRDRASPPTGAVEQV